MKLQFWGVRGYVPTPGAEYLHYGGNTCCTALMGANGELVVIDTGTGFCQFGDALVGREFGRGGGEMTLLISHTYWDHILGLPFPALVHIPGNRLHIYGPDSTRGSLQMVYDGMLSPVYSPVYGLAHIGATHSFQPISTTPFMVGGLRISAMPLSQRKHSPIWAYRVEEGSRSVVYITDVRYTNDLIWQQALHFADRASILVHSAPYTRHEQVQDYGHSRVEDAIELAQKAGAEQLMLFHHAPTRTDAQLHAIVKHYRDRLVTQGSGLLLDAAREGEEIEV
ncbi:metal-dependent hydrolase [Oscillochloris trichoides DG-6]|uniref:Metal-dependent hydrolase n=1 Tax=Oscillochloris trichoides DG-6 TaxID=765420 RepID=E1II60_9CHLR|nr:MBL fold metallo-hydrolase [Oscillochloris trichoides]EFO79178.1 metal-dependent hydrolase [Oscillochloris trichoides DG-6]